MKGTKGPKTTEALAAEIAPELLRRMQDRGNGSRDGLDPSTWLARKLAGLLPMQAALVGFRLAQSMRDTRSGDMQAPTVHTLLRSVHRIDTRRGAYT